jgi:hypothetical protein
MLPPLLSLLALITLIIIGEVKIRKGRAILLTDLEGP